MLSLRHITATGLLFVGLSVNLSAEEVIVPTAEPETSEATEYSVQLPGRGMTMEAVQNRFGEAVEKFSAVGEPPISKWVFKDFSVYFESEFVIHAVVNSN